MKVTDPALLSQLNANASKTVSPIGSSSVPVTDPALLAQLNANSSKDKRYSSGEAFAITAAQNVIPDAGALAAGLVAGKSVLLATAPLAATGVGATVSVGASILAFIGTSLLARAGIRYGQDKIVENFVPDINEINANIAQNNPNAQTAANVASSLVVASPSAATRSLAQAALPQTTLPNRVANALINNPRKTGAGIGAAAGTVEEALNADKRNEDDTLADKATRVAINAGGGAALPGLNSLGRKIDNAAGFVSDKIIDKTGIDKVVGSAANKASEFTNKVIDKTGIGEFTNNAIDKFDKTSVGKALGRDIDAASKESKDAIQTLADANNYIATHKIIMPGGQKGSVRSKVSDDKLDGLRVTEDGRTIPYHVDAFAKSRVLRENVTELRKQLAKEQDKDQIERIEAEIKVQDTLATRLEFYAADAKSVHEKALKQVTHPAHARAVEEDINVRNTAKDKLSVAADQNFDKRATSDTSSLSTEPTNVASSIRDSILKGRDYRKQRTREIYNGKQVLDKDGKPSIDKYGDEVFDENTVFEKSANGNWQVVEKPVRDKVTKQPILQKGQIFPASHYKDVPLGKELVDDLLVRKLDKLSSGSKGESSLTDQVLGKAVKLGLIQNAGDKKSQFYVSGKNPTLGQLQELRKFMNAHTDKRNSSHNYQNGELKNTFGQIEKAIAEKASDPNVRRSLLAARRTRTEQGDRYDYDPKTPKVGSRLARDIGQSVDSNGVLSAIETAEPHDLLRLMKTLENTSEGRKSINLYTKYLTDKLINDATETKTGQVKAFTGSSVSRSLAPWLKPIQIIHKGKPYTLNNGKLQLLRMYNREDPSGKVLNMKDALKLSDNETKIFTEEMKFMIAYDAIPVNTTINTSNTANVLADAERSKVLSDSLTLKGIANDYKATGPGLIKLGVNYTKNLARYIRTTKLDKYEKEKLQQLYNHAERLEALNKRQAALEAEAANSSKANSEDDSK